MVAPETVFDLSQADERVVRSYQCTRVSRLFAPVTLGYLTVTNRRIVYHSTGKSATGRSVLVSEMPVEDAAGVSVYIGNSVNWLQFIGFAVGLFMATFLLDALLPAFFTGWIFAALLMVPYGLYRLSAGNWLSEEARDMIRSTVPVLGGSGVTGDAERWAARFRWMFLLGAAILAWALVRSDALGYLWYRALPVAMVMLGVVYFFLFVAVFGRQSAFSLMISSRTAQGSGIFIPGNTFRLFTKADRSVIDSMSGYPDVDAPAVAHELGALLTDLRVLGDLGIDKWAAAPATAAQGGQKPGPATGQAAGSSRSETW